jgi:glycosyltransferase involved in cell wall biosynthesis
VKDISIIIPSLNEPYLDKTVEDIRRNATTDVEILVGDDAVEKLGQRALMNKLAREASGRYIMKTDAHCSFGPGFDAIMLEDMRDNWILAPYLLPLDAENWKVRFDKRMAGYVFDSNLVMHHAETTQDLLQETMCLQGSCWMISKENYWNWNICDESLGSWGGQAVELGIKAYLNGGACYTTKKTYYGHLFRVNEEDFPYQRHQDVIDAGHQAVLSKLKTPAICPLIAKYNFPLDWKDDVMCYN